MQNQNVIVKQGKFEDCRCRDTEGKIAVMSKTISFRRPGVIFLLIKGTGFFGLSWNVEAPHPIEFM